MGGYYSWAFIGFLLYVCMYFCRDDLASYEHVSAINFSCHMHDSKILQGKEKLLGRVEGVKEGWDSALFGNYSPW